MTGNVKTWRTGFRRNDSGATAVEFGFIALPFFMFIFGIINSGWFFFNQHLLDRGVEDAGRRIRTGEAQKAGVTVSEFRNLVCNSINGNQSYSTPTAGVVDCSKITILLQSANTWAEIGPQACLSAGSQTVSSGTGTNSLTTLSGAQSRRVLMTACYQWDFAGSLPFMKLGNMSNGAYMYSSSTAFVTEEYQ
ncbi:MAG: pilus assembly protein [Hyphomicrobiaceae bacterium]|nr:pilus assembly protein [Hyphomicrobiaceae bacterium]